ncbi:MAG: T9SS type A sorting domain-containing protein [Bacteroidetes bacterium]|nr:T9SS type A sorting domain-containing protein [Bacteroidota bacterium]
MKNILIFFLVFGTIATKAQTPVWSTAIAPILYNNCTSCHHEGGLAPFSLLTYQNAVDNGYDISADVTSKKMPPWPPDATYRRFAHERILSAADIQKINQWVIGGTPSGDTTLAPAKPIYTNTSALGTPDLSLRIPSFTVPASQVNDLYTCFVVHNSLAQTEFITGIEVLPGNSSIVHHVLVYQDTTGQAATLDNATPEPGYTSFGGIGITGQPILVAGWVPGSQPAYLPPNMGIKLYANSDLVLQIHYPAGSANKLDSTRINFKLSTGSLRTVSLAPILNHQTSLLNGPLHIAANTTATFQEYFQMPNLADITVLSVAPHAHLINKTWLSYVVTPLNDTIPLIKINDWDFHWQGSYGFRNLMRIPKQSKLYGFATYDNTSTNPHNPNSPPQAVNLGESTTDEMMLIYFAYTIYQVGDENIVTDTTTLVDITDSSTATAITEPVNGIVSTPQFYELVPNPSGNETQLSYFLPQQTEASLQVFDLSGKLIDEVKLPSSLGINGYKYAVAKLQAGQYICQLNAAGMKKSKTLIVVH